MTVTHSLAILAVTILMTALVWPQTSSSVPAVSSEPSPDQWAYSLNVAGYIVPHDRSYASPTFAADRGRVHLGARYNYEDQETGSVWVGYNFSAGDKLALEVTPMIGGVFGNTTGVAPGYLASLTWRRVELSTEGEYVFDTKDRSGNFFYSWMELSYSPLEWFRAGLVAQRTKAYHTNLDIQRGVLIGFSHKRMEFTTYIFNAGWTDPTVVLSLGFSF
jgi:hypothetical protein